MHGQVELDRGAWGYDRMDSRPHPDMDQVVSTSQQPHSQLHVRSQAACSQTGMHCHVELDRGAWGNDRINPGPLPDSGACIRS